ncbi:RNI-like protein [Anaeromyces robustus]|uniref:RNI-like protein n=1 Tax=Anaeromyces robustus TaxID=1754192 RepID=A0A1Y1XR27_9FUNG|nr:RNI-like protein [Anaeromyces robustus]|eukprot:ORX88187.1 RNI-like protein [Anaeromyces robustus]
MYFKNLLKVLLSASTLSIVLADDCKDIKDYLKKKHKNINVEDNIQYCNINDNGKITDIGIRSVTITEEDVNKILSYSTIERLEFYCGLIKSSNSDSGPVFSNYEQFPSAISNMPNLKKLNFEYDGFREHEKYEIDRGLLRLSNTVEKLTFSGVEFSSYNFEEIGTLRNLNSLIIYNSSRDTDEKNMFEPLKNLNELKTLVINDFHHFKLTEIPPFVFSLSKLEILTITGHELKTIPNELANLSNLEGLNLSYNHINSELPESLNNLTKLNFIDFTDNQNLFGKILTNPTLKECYYEPSYNLCQEKEMKCLQVKFRNCINDNDNISTNKRCGEGIGSCPMGKCCSKYGWCGISEKHCLPSNGCQSKFGECSMEYLVSSNGKCGPNNGRCPYGQCCSKYGWCGTSEKYCLIENGCQSEFGDCSNQQFNISNNGKCGEDDGNCPTGECCSKYGWCGISEKHCLIDQGCQSEFGQCKTKTTIPISYNGQCGKEYGKCPSSQCCSKYGWCGTSDKYCNEGCQGLYGTCQ